MTPEAFFDCLHIASRIGEPMNGVSRLDFQRIAFLSCLLSIYQAKPVADWGYRFANTGFGSPFSDQLNEAIGWLEGSDKLNQTDGRFYLTESGTSLLNILCSQESLGTRAVCVDAACSSMLAVPLSTMAIGIEQEPTVAASRLRTAATMLLEEPYLQILHDHFAILAKVLPPSESDLFSPSVLWLSYMSGTTLSEKMESGSMESAQ